MQSTKQNNEQSKIHNNIKWWNSVTFHSYVHHLLTSNKVDSILILTRLMLIFYCTRYSLLSINQTSKTRKLSTVIFSRYCIYIIILPSTCTNNEKWPLNACMWNELQYKTDKWGKFTTAASDNHFTRRNCFDEVKTYSVTHCNRFSNRTVGRYKTYSPDFAYLRKIYGVTKLQPLCYHVARHLDSTHITYQWYHVLDRQTLTASQHIHVSGKKSTPLYICLNFQGSIITKFWVNSATSNCQQITKFHWSVNACISYNKFSKVTPKHKVSTSNRASWWIVCANIKHS